MQAVLVMFRSDGERRSFSIARDMTVIGRREDCDLRIPLGEVSRKHCRLVRDGDSLRLEDLGSSNGTFHNGERVQEVILNPGDSVQVGPVLFVLQIDGVPADEELHPFSGPSEEEAPVAARSNDLGPLSPTAQSEADGELAPLPMSEEEMGSEEPLVLEGLEDGAEEATAHEAEDGGLDADAFMMLEEDEQTHTGPPAETPFDVDAQQQPHA